jgi:hypothetical protein
VAHDTDTGQTDRCRLLSLLAVSRQPNDEQCVEAARAAGLPPTAHVPTARCLAYMGLPLLPPPRAPAGRSSRAGVALGRHEPRLQALLRTALDGALSTKMFPFVDDGDEEEVGDVSGATASNRVGNGGPVTPASPRSPRAELVGSWAMHRQRALARASVSNTATTSPPPHEYHGPDAEKMTRESPKLLVLILGGSNRAELRCALEAGGGGKVAFGCTALLTPLEYMRVLRVTGAAVAEGQDAEASEVDGAPAGRRVAPVLQGLSASLRGSD